MHNVQKFDWSNGATIDQEKTIDQAKDMISYLVDKLQQDLNNPLLQAEVQGKLQALNSSQLERGLVRPPGESSKGANPFGSERRVETHSSGACTSP